MSQSIRKAHKTRLRRLDTGDIVAEADEHPFAPAWEDAPPGDHYLGAEVESVDGRVFRGQSDIDHSTKLFEYRPGMDISQMSGTFSRGSSAWQFEADKYGEGSLEEAGNHVLRDDHWVRNPITGLYERSTLLEGQRTNMLVRSQELDVSPWTTDAGGLRGIIIPDATLAPDGTITADQLVKHEAETAAYRYQIRSVNTELTYAASFWLKYGSGPPWVRFSMSSQMAAFNAQTGDAVSQNGAASTVTYPNNWYLCRVIFTPTSGIFLLRLVNPATSTSAIDYNPEEGHYIWGTQLEEATSPSSYIPTSSSLVTRAADNLTFDFPHAPQPMTVYCRFVESGNTLVGSTSNGVWQLGSGGTDRVFLYALGSGRYGVWYDNNAASFTDVPEIGDHVEIIAEISESGVVAHQSINYAAPTTSSTVSRPHIVPTTFNNTIYIGSRGSTAGFSGIKHVRIDKGAHSLEDMRRAAGVSTSILSFDTQGNEGSFSRGSEASYLSP